jgi:hypothetical protein
MRIGSTNLTHAVLMYGVNAGPSITLASLIREYRCATCEGVLGILPEVHDGVAIRLRVVCHRCNVEAPDVIHVEQLRREAIATQQVLNGLPEHLRQAITGQADADAVGVAALLLYPPTKEKS